MEPCLVDVSPILEVLGESVTVSGELSMDSLVVGAEEFVFRGPAHYEAAVTNVGTAFIASGKISAPVIATCVRCLNEFPMDIEADIEGFYVFPGHDEDVPEEQEIEYVNADETIDLAPALFAALVLEAPFAPLHDENCAGLCAVCGEDLNQGLCSCRDDTVSPEHPFAALKTLLGNGDGPPLN